MSKPYIFDASGSDLGRQQLELLQIILDKPSIESLSGCDIRPGQRCLDVGAGAGSLTHWLADQVGPTGSVVAVDLATDHIEPRDNIETYQHDINEGVPVEGTFDLIHVRLLLMHLPTREAIFKSLVEALSPGGWLVVGDFTFRKLQVLTAPSQADKDLWEHMMHTSHGVASPKRGISFDWAEQAGTRMEEAGLRNVHSLEFSETTPGGSPGCLLHLNLNTQAEPLLTQFGITQDELKRYRELMLDPSFRAWFYQFHCTRGQKPA